MFEQLLHAICTKNVRLVYDILEDHPELALRKLDNSGTVLQLALSVDSYLIVDIVIDAEKRHRSKLNALHSTSNNTGWNTLHFACCFADDSTLNLTLDHIDKHMCRELAQHTPNDCGLIPACMLSKNSNTISDKTILRVVKLSKLVSDKTLREEIDPYTVLKTLTPEQRRTDFADTIFMACDSVNFARSMILISNTHPDSNAIPNEHKSHHFEFTKTLRKAAQLPKSAESSEALAWLQLLRRAQTTIKFSTGNCIEYATLVAYDLIKKGCVNVEILQIANGDHAFVVINRDRINPLNDFTTWGDNVYVIDAWAGKIFPAREIGSQLSTFTRLYTNKDDLAMSQVNIVGKFNPLFHTFQEYVSFSDDFAPAIRDFYTCFPFLDNFCTPDTISKAIGITRKLIATTNDMKDFSITALLNPVRAHLLKADTQLQSIQSKLANNKITPHQALATLINSFIRHRKTFMKFQHRISDILEAPECIYKSHQ